MSYKFLELVAEVGADTSKFTASMGGIKGQVESVKGVAMKALGTAGLAGAVAKAGQFAADSVRGWSEYAEVVEKSARLSGVSSEEMSRLIQTADDFRVSQESLESAMKMGLKNGFVPTIDNLANLADRLQEIEDPSQRAAQASKIFGRQWAEIEPLFARGGKAIRDGTAAIADNLIVTEAAIQQNKEYIKNLDDFQDGWQGVKNDIGRNAIPVLNSLFAAATDNEDSLIRSRYQLAQWIKTTPGWIQALANADGWIEKVNASYTDLTQSVGTYTGRMGALQKAGALLEEQQRVEQQAWDDVTTSMKEYNDQLLFQIASKGLSGDAALDLAKKMGLVDEATMSAMDAVSILKSQYDEAKMSAGEYATKISDIQAAIASLESRHVEITIDAILNEIRNAVAGANEAGRRTGTDRYGGERTFDGERALGGPVYPGHTYLVGELGAETFMPQVAGFISQSGKATQPAPVVNVYVSGTGNPDYVAQKAADLVMQKFKR